MKTFDEYISGKSICEAFKDIECLNGLNPKKIQDFLEKKLKDDLFLGRSDSVKFSDNFGPKCKVAMWTWKIYGSGGKKLTGGTVEKWIIGAFKLPKENVKCHKEHPVGRKGLIGDEYEYTLFIGIPEDIKSFF